MAPNRRYQKGVRGEKKSRRWLERQGYFVVEARGSHGAVDLVATSVKRLLLVQVKSGRQLTRSEFAAARDALRSIPIPFDDGDGPVTRELHHWPDRAREPVVEVVN